MSKQLNESASFPVKAAKSPNIKAILFIFAVACGLLPVPSQMSSACAQLIQNGTIQSCAKKIFDTILAREFNDVDKELKALANFSYPTASGLKDDNNKVRFTSPSADMLAASLAVLCADNKINWDNSSKSLSTKQEVNEFKKTLLGQALTIMDCFSVKTKFTVSTGPSKAAKITQTINNSSNSSSTSNNTTSSSNAAAINAIASSPNYKNTGPHSKDIFDLKSTVGQKEYLSSPVFRISCSIFPAKHPFIKPLNLKGRKNNTNKLFFGEGHWYTECEVFFNNNQDADAFMVKIKNANVFNNNILDNLYVAKTKPLSNGYFLVGTEFGDAYISAAKMNENLDTKETAEALVEETAEQPPFVDRSYRSRNKEALAKMHALGISYVDDPVQFAEDLSKEF